VKTFLYFLIPFSVVLLAFCVFQAVTQ